MNWEVKKRFRRITAFMLALILALSNVNLESALAAVMTTEEVEDAITITHELVSGGKEAEIMICEAAPDIRITKVQMVRGESVVVATGSNAIKATPSESVRPGKDETEELETATPSEPGRINTASEKPEELPPAPPSEPQSPAVPGKIDTTAEKPQAPAGPDQEEPVEEKETGRATASEASDEEIPVLELAQGDSTWRFLVNENRTYRFKITYQTIEDNKLVKKSVVVDYEVDDIQNVMLLGDELLTITSDIHGEGKEEGLELPVDRVTEGSLVVSYKVPKDVTGRWIKIEFPRHVEIINYPKTAPLDGTKTTVTKKSVDGVWVYTLHAAILDDVTEDIQFQVDYKSSVPYWLTDKEKEAYASAEGLNFGSIRAEAGDGNNHSLAEAEIGPLSAKINTGENTFGIVRADSSILDEPVNCTVDNYKLEEQRISHKGMWNMQYDPNAIYQGAAPVALKQLKIYAPQHFRYEVLPNWEKRLYELGEDDSGHYLIYNFQVPKDIGNFRAFWYQLNYRLADGESVEEGQVYFPLKAPELTFVYAGEERVRDEPMMSSITISSQRYTTADQLKMILTPAPAKFWAGGVIGRGKAADAGTGVELDNTAEKGENADILPKYSLEGAKLTIQLPEGIFIDASRVGSSDVLQMSLLPGDQVAGPTGDVKTVSVKTAEALLSDGTTAPMKVWRYGSSSGYEYWRGRLADYGSIDPQTRITGYCIELGSLYRAKFWVTLVNLQAAAVKADGSPYPLYGEEPETVKMDVGFDYEGNSKTGSTDMVIQKLLEQDRLQVEGARLTEVAAGQELVSSGTCSVINTSGETSDQSKIPVLPESDMEQGVLTITLPQEITVSTGNGRLIGSSVRLDNDVYTGILPDYPPKTAVIKKMDAMLDDGSLREIDPESGALVGELGEGEIIRGYRVEFEKLYRAQCRFDLYQLKMPKTKADGTPFSPSGDIVSITSEVICGENRKSGTTDFKVKGVSVEECLKLNYQYTSVYSSPVSFIPLYGWRIPAAGYSGRAWISNSGYRNGGNYTGPSHHGEGAELDIEYPYGVSPVSWEFKPIGEGDSLLPEFKPEADIEKVLLYLDNGDTVEAPLTRSGADGLVHVTVNAADIIPDDRCVVKITVSIRKLYNAKYEVYATGTMPLLRPDGNLFQAEKGYMTSELRRGETVRSGQILYEIKPFQCHPFTVSPSSPPNISVLLQTAAGIGYIDVTPPVGPNGIAINPSVEFNGEDLMNAFTGGIRVPPRWPAGWSIEYETSFGNSGSYEIPSTWNLYENRIFAELAAGEDFTKIRMNYPGTYLMGITAKGILFSLSAASQEWKALPRDPENPNMVILNGGYVDRADCPGHPENRTGEISIALPIHTSVTLKQGGMGAAIDEFGYQGAVVEAEFTPRYEIGFLEIPNQFRSFVFGNETYYIEWLGGNDFVLQEDTTSPYRSTMVKTADGSASYIKISRRDAGLRTHTPPYSNQYFSASYNKISQTTIPLKLKVLPGTSTGAHPLFGKTYVDMKGYQNKQAEVEAVSGILVTLDGAAADSQGICQDGDTVSERLFLLDSGEKTITIKLNNITGINTMLGIDDTYQGERLKFSPDQRKRLNAVYSISSDQDRLTDYEVIIPVPKEGKRVTYRKPDGTQAAAVSQFNMELRGPVSRGNMLNDVQLSYQLGDGDYISEDEVGGHWEQVTAVRAFLKEFSSEGVGKPTMNLFLNLEAEEKKVDNLLEAYMAPAYSFKTSDGTASGQIYGGLATFVHGNHEISGIVWNDRNENGIRESGEPLMKDVVAELWNDTEKLAETKTDGNGAYILDTYRSDNLFVKLIIPRKTEEAGDMVLTKPFAEGATAANDSDYLRPADGDLSYGVARFPDSQTSSKTNVDAGLCYLPVVTAEDIQVKSRLTGQARARVTVKYGPAPVIRFDEAKDTQVATVSASGLVNATGNQGDETTAKAWVVNSLGDRVEAEYTIRILSNNTPDIMAHDWSLVEGDQVSDWWYGVECDDPDDTWLTKQGSMFADTGMEKRVTVHREESVGEDSQIEPEDALREPGTYYVRYSAIDTDGNEGVAITKLTVYGKLESREPRTHHIVTEDRMLEPEQNHFYYLEEAGGSPIYVSSDQVEMIPAETSLKTAGQKRVTFSADHPAVLTVGGVTAGDGRRRQTEDTYQLDSRPEIIGAGDIVVTPGESLNLLDGVSAFYSHFEGESAITRQAAVTVKDPEGGVIEGGHYTAPDTPGNYTLTYHAKAGEEYENGENTKDKEIKLMVCGTVEVEAPEVLYLTPEEAKSPETVWNKLKPEVRAWYNDPTAGPPTALSETALTYTVRKSSATGEAEAVDIKAEYTVEGLVISSETATTRVVVRKVPGVTAMQDVHLRSGTPFDPEEGISLEEVDPEGKNTWSIIDGLMDGKVDTQTVGRRSLTYRAEDPLTGAQKDTTRLIYVHGNPAVTADNGTLFTHQSVGADKLTAIIQQSARASVQYVKTDGTVNTVVIPATGLHYEIRPEENYQPQTEGTYKVTVSVNDGEYIPEGIPLAPADGTCQAEVTISDKIYEVKFNTNNDAAHHRGEFEGGAEQFTTKAVHGKRMADLPAPTAAEGYHFDGYKTQVSFTTTDDLTLGDGTTIPAGTAIPVGMMLSAEQVAGLKIYSDVNFQAYFSASPEIEGKNIPLYVGETYKRSDLGIKVTDLDGNAAAPTVDDGHVDTSKAGTYQVKASTADSDGNTAEKFVYVQVVGKTELEGNMPIHVRQGTVLTPEQLRSGISAFYQAPQDIPESPWDESNKVNGGQPTDRKEIEFMLAGTVDKETVGRTELAVSASGMIPGREAAGRAEAVRKVYVHGNPTVTADNGTLFTYQSTGADKLAAVIQQSARASVQYVNEDGTVETVTVPSADLHYEIKPEENYQPQTEGTYKVTITMNDGAYIPAGIPLAPVEAEYQAEVVVSEKIYNVKFNTNNDTAHHRGEFEGGAEQFTTTAAHGKQMADVPAPTAAEGYHFDGYKTLVSFTTTDDLMIGDGTTIPAGTAIPVGTMLSAEQVAGLKIYSDVNFQAYFSASPEIEGKNIPLYVGETYKRSDLGIKVTDLDGNAAAPTVDDGHVDTSKAGTYQVKASTADSDGNTAEKFVYVQVVGKTELEGNTPIHVRQGTVLTPEQLKTGISAFYQAPQEIPESPWDESNKVNGGQPTDRKEIEFMLAGTVDKENVGRTELAVSASGMIPGREAAGRAEAVRKVYVHGNPTVTADNGALFTHQSTGEDVLTAAIQQSARASVQYVQTDGTVHTVVVSEADLHYEIRPEENYQPQKEGTYKVTITMNDGTYIPAGIPLVPVDAEYQAEIAVSDKLYNVKFNTNNDAAHHRGEFEGGAEEFDTKAAHGKQMADVPAPTAAEGYHFDGYKTQVSFTTTDDLTPGVGTTIPAGTAIPVGTMLSAEQVAGLKIYSDVKFQAYFSASPEIKGKNIQLYVGETYKRIDLGIEVTDLDDNAAVPTVDDGHVDTSKEGTYQVKISTEDSDGNTAEKFVYVQVVGKTELEGNTPIHVRQGIVLTPERLKTGISAFYQAPQDIPELPWDESNKVNGGQPADRKETTFTLDRTVETETVGLTELALNAPGMIPGREAVGKAEAVRKVFVHGNPTITADNGALFTHQSTGAEKLTEVIQQSALASIQYVMADGTVNTAEVPAADLHYEIRQEENYQLQKEGTYKVTITMNDGAYIPAGIPLVPIDAEYQINVVVSDKIYNVKFSTNNDAAHHRGEFEGGTEEYTTTAVHGKQMTALPAATAMEGYHLDGYKTLVSFITTDDLTLGAGTTIPAGAAIPVGTMLSQKQIAGLKIYSDMRFQAVFSAVPVINGENVILYEHEEYSREQLRIQVTDEDGDANSHVVDDSHVDPGVPGTYQVKVTASDAGGNKTEKYLYVQVVGKTKLAAVPDLHTRKGTRPGELHLLQGVKAVCLKPSDIPEKPWPDENKINNGWPADLTEVTVYTDDTVDTDQIRKTEISVTAPGLVPGREEAGKANGTRKVYIHGVPVVLAYDNGLYTHQSADASDLEKIVRTGEGGAAERDAMSAYVEYAQVDGSIKRVTISPEKISCRVQAYVPQKEGTYTVLAETDDSSVLPHVTGITPVSGKKEVKITVADKMYEVVFKMGEHGELANPSDEETTVAHGKKVRVPELSPEEGYELNYWMDERGNKVNLSDILITDNCKFTAVFKIQEFTVRFIGKKSRVIKTEIVMYGHDAAPPWDDRDVTNLRFDGWSTSYRKIKSDMDIYTTYWKPEGGGPNGGGGYVPSGPGVSSDPDHSMESEEMTGPPSVNTLIDNGLIPKGIMLASHDKQSLPIAGNLQNDMNAGIGYQVTLVDGTVPLTEDIPLVGGQAQVIAAAESRKKCILHIILMLISAIEGIYLIFKCKRDKKELEKLNMQKEESDAS